MFHCLHDCLLQKTNKRHSLKLFKIMKSEQLMCNGSPLTRFVETDYQRIDPRLKASTFSLSNSVKQGRNLDPQGCLFTQTTEQFLAAVQSYPEPTKSTES